jgi:hypothetical protein
LQFENELASFLSRGDLESASSFDVSQDAYAVVSFPCSCANFGSAVTVAFKEALHGTVLEGGLDVTLHGTRAFNPVMKGDTAAGDKIASHPWGEFYGLTLHFGERQSVARLVVNLERSNFSYPKQVLIFSRLAFHSPLLVSGEHIDSFPHSQETRAKPQKVILQTLVMKDDFSLAVELEISEFPPLTEGWLS